MLPSFHPTFFRHARCVTTRFLVVAVAGCANGDTDVAKTSKANEAGIAKSENAHHAIANASPLSMAAAPALWSRANSTMAPDASPDTPASPVSAPGTLPKPGRAELLLDAISDEPLGTLVAIDRPGNLAGRPPVEPHVGDTIAQRQASAR